MAAQINTNVYSLNAQRNLSKNSLGLQSAIERLSSGLRVNSARDDASGLAAGMGLDSSARQTAVLIRTAQDSISTAETIDGQLSVLGDVLLRMVELQTTPSASNNAELTKLAARATTLIASSSSTAGTITSATALAGLNSAITSVAADRATQGANMNDAEFNIQTLQVAYTNTKAAYSRIMDADFAEETSRLARFQVLQQAGTAMIAQANALPNNVLSLLR